jgi:hypothetical protein
VEDPLLQTDIIDFAHHAAFQRLAAEGGGMAGEGVLLGLTHPSLRNILHRTTSPARRTQRIQSWVDGVEDTHPDVVTDTPSDVYDPIDLGDLPPRPSMSRQPTPTQGGWSQATYMVSRWAPDAETDPFDLEEGRAHLRQRARPLARLQEHIRGAGRFTNWALA